LVALGHHRLHSYCAFDGINHRGKFNEYTIPRGLHEATPVLRHESISGFPVFAECSGGTDLVEPHKARVARHIRRCCSSDRANCARWTEIDFDNAVWIVPAATMKMKRPHRVPLARQAIVILRELHGITGQGEFVFPAVDSVRRPMSNNTLNAALRRLGYSTEEVSVSGFRATASTLLNEMGRWNPDAIERQLAHMEENDVRRAYMHAAEFWIERVEMMQVWADHLDQLRYGSPAEGRIKPFVVSQG
jgi:integrase-like protein